MTRKMAKPRMAEGVDDERGRRGMGRRRTISMSKTRKITAKRKNRSEKGIRAEAFGSNPHSNGDSFSRSW